MRLLGIVVAGIGAATLAGCGGGDSGGSTAGVPEGSRLAVAASPGGVQQATAVREGISVVGVGMADGVPDVVGWSFGVRTQAATAEAALAEVEEATERLLAALRGAGIGTDDLRTEHVSLYPLTNEEYGGAADVRVRGYAASNTVRVTVRDMAKAGGIVDAAVAAGANEVYGPELRVADTRARYASALEAAYEDARARAEAMAAKAGVELGPPLAIVEGGGGGGSVYGDAVAAEEPAELAIEPGRTSTSAAVTVTFAIG